MKYFLCLILAVFQVEAAASSYFVSPAGNDTTGNGSIGNPWLTITKGINSMSGGDTLNIRAGTYVPGTGAESVPLPNPPSGGGEGTRTVITAYNSEAALIFPSSGNFCWNNNTGAYVDFVDLYISLTNAVGSSGAAIKFTDNANHCRVIRCTLERVHTGHGILNSPGNADNADNLIISNSIVRYNGWQWDGGTADHNCYVECRNTIIDGCLIAFAQDHGIHRFSGPQGPGDIYRNNILIGNQHGIGIYSTTNHTVYNNIAYSNIVAFVNGFESGSIRFINNTAYKNTLNFLVQENVTGWTLLQNNISANGGGGVNPGIEIDGSGQIVTNINNLSYDNVGAGNYVNNNGANTITANNLFGDQYDAAFADAANTNFAITASSSARNAGATSATVPVDILGVTRPQESVYDIGAYEYNAGGTTPTVTINATTPTALENPVTPGVFTISRDITNSAVTVNYQVAGTAVNGTDYNTITTNVTIAAGVFTGTVTITPIVDGSGEGNETVILNLWPNAAYTLSTPTNATVTIIDAQPSSPTSRGRKPPGVGKKGR